MGVLVWVWMMDWHYSEALVVSSTNSWYYLSISCFSLLNSLYLSLNSRVISLICLSESCLMPITSNYFSSAISLNCLPHWSSLLTVSPCIVFKQFSNLYFSSVIFLIVSITLLIFKSNCCFIVSTWVFIICISWWYWCLSILCCYYILKS